ncbi:MAG: cysteine hydrolase family protein [Francisellaceae bacterium]
MEKTLLLVCDFINEIVDEKGVTGVHNAPRIMADKTMEKANHMIAWARQHKIPVAHVKVGFDANYLSCPKSSPMFSKAAEFKKYQLGTWATEFHPEMDVAEHDHIVIKHRVSALYGTDLEPLLRAGQIEHVVLCGVSTTYVIESTARELHDRDFTVTVIADACNAATEASHQASLVALSRFCQIKNHGDF